MNHQSFNLVQFELIDRCKTICTV